MAKPGPDPRSLEEAIDVFWDRVDEGDLDECWLYDGHVINSGYGLFYVRAGNRELAHRFAYRITEGEIPEGMFVCHHCDVKLCVNPDHLFVGDPADNTQDMMEKGRHYNTRKDVCKRGHRLTPDNRVNGTGYCLACNRIHWRKSYYKAKKLGKEWARP